MCVQASSRRSSRRKCTERWQASTVRCPCCVSPTGHVIVIVMLRLCCEGSAPLRVIPGRPVNLQSPHAQCRRPLRNGLLSIAWFDFLQHKHSRSDLRRCSMSGSPLTRRLSLHPLSLSCFTGTGVVKENGAGASRFHVDQRVVAAPWPSNEGNGTWQQYVVVEEKVCINDLRKPGHWLRPGPVSSHAIQG